MKFHRCPSLLLSALIATMAGSVYAAELRFAHTAVEKAIKTQLFRDDDKWRLANPDKCNAPYLETPSVRILGGRLLVKARFAGRVGTQLMGTCLSVGEPSWITVSGRLAIDGPILSLQDVRIESIEKPAVRAVASALIEGAIRSSLKVNLEQWIVPLLASANTAPYVVNFSDLTIKLIEADADRLRLAVDFGLAFR